MSDRPTCPRCAKPIQDTAYVCSDCCEALRRSLRDVEKVAGDITLTVAKLDRMARTGGTAPMEDDWHKGAGALVSTPMPVNLDAASRHDAAVNTLATWCRHITEERGVQPAELAHPLATMANFLRGCVTWLAHRPEGDEAFNDIEAACRTIVRLVDRPPDRTVVGRCPCGTYLYATAGADAVRCQGCGTSYDVASSREALRIDLEDRLMTAGQIATMAAHLGLAKGRESARLLVNLWASRGRIVAHGRIDGDPVFRFGEVLTRLIEVHGTAA